ncbi:MAG: hypothetical protein J6T18_09510 [Bacteroidaceae bacterium]|nr:hypothetical protein [Bacteroidaceae bacterium]MBO7589643.1 hypothetical protein [Bacteroidaceae bacterium]MBP5646588.1 hypothetical protein [Bacteroidaceae bacterium]
MKPFLKKTMLIALFSAAAVNAAVITTIESGKRKEILASDVAGQAGDLDYLIDPISGTKTIVEWVISLFKNNNGPLDSNQQTEKCNTFEFRAQVQQKGYTTKQLAGAFDAYYKNEDSTSGGNVNGSGSSNSNYDNNASSSISTSDFDLGEHRFRVCLARNQGHCKPVNDTEDCSARLERIMKILKKMYK